MLRPYPFLVVVLVWRQDRITRSVRRNGEPPDATSQLLTGIDVEPVVDAAVHPRQPCLRDHGVQVIALLREEGAQHLRPRCGEAAVAGGI